VFVDFAPPLCRTVYREAVIIGLVVVLVLVLGLPATALVIAPRLRPAKPHPRLGTADRAFHLARGRDGHIASTPPPGIPPGELGALVLPEAHYQQATATLLDLAKRGHLQIALHTAPTSEDATAWWTLAPAAGRDQLRDYERVLLEEVGVTTGPVQFPNLTIQSVDRVARTLRKAAHHRSNHTENALALQRGIARTPNDIDARWFAHAIALDVSPTLTHSLNARHAPTPQWITTHCSHPITWSLLNDLALQGSPLLPQTPYAAGYQGGTIFG